MSDNGINDAALKGIAPAPDSIMTTPAPDSTMATSAPDNTSAMTAPVPDDTSANAHTIVYCSDDPRCSAHIRKRYGLKPLILYRRGLSGTDRHRQLHCQQRLLIDLSQRSAMELTAELGAVLLTGRALLPAPMVIVVVVAADHATDRFDGAGAVIHHIRQPNGGHSYYFDMIDVPPSFSVCDAVIAAPGGGNVPTPTPAGDGSDAATAADDSGNAATAADVCLTLQYAELYRLTTYYLGPHQVLTVAIDGTNEQWRGAVDSACQLAEHYLDLQRRVYHDFSVHHQILEHCTARHNLSQSQVYQLRNRLQRHPTLSGEAQQVLYRCNSYAEISAALS